MTSSRVTMAISAIDCALWDLRGRVAGLPVFRLLGGPFRTMILAYASTLGYSIDLGRVRERAAALVADGYTAMKWFFRDGPTDGPDGVINHRDWRKAPTVKKLIWKVIPDETTRLAALKRGEVDLAYSIRGELAEELRRTPGLELKPVVINSPFWIYFADQWDPKSPWHDARVRKAVTLALDREGINQALTLGHSLLTGSIVPKDYEFYWQPPKIPHDPAAARQLLAEAGFKGGFDAGEYYCDSSYANLAEAALNSLEDVGIRVKLRPIERAAFNTGYAEKKYRNIIQGGSGAFGNAATRMETFVVKGGAYVYGSYPDIDDLFAQQAVETDRAKRTPILQRMQQLVHERTVYAPLWQLAFLNGQGPRVGEAAFGLISGHPYSAPYEDVRLKNGA